MTNCELESVNTCASHTHQKIEDIRGLLERREMSPYDVASDGVSVLRISLSLLLDFGILMLMKISSLQELCNMVSVHYWPNMAPLGC